MTGTRRWFLRLAGLAAAILACVSLTLAQRGAGSGQQEEPASRVLRVTSRLVLLDVIVADAQRHPVMDLTQKEFAVLEDGKTRNITAFELVRSAPAATAAASIAAASAQIPALPPGIFSNRPQTGPSRGAVGILLLDGLNTTYTDQTRIRQAMMQYAERRLAEGQTLAVMALGSDLTVLQDFTTDPKLLRAALRRYRQDRPALGAVNDTKDVPESSMPDAAEYMAPLVEHVKQFEAERTATATDTRVRITLAALRAIANAVGGYPGRKNLVWVSDAFPLGFNPQWVERMTTDSNTSIASQQVRGPLGTAMRRGVAHIGFPRQYETELRQTAALLTAAQVAVYPVDARGLLGNETLDASRRAKAAYIDSSPTAAKDLLGSDTDSIDVRSTMREVADDTGGKAFYGTNDIELAVSESVADASTYYQLAYMPNKSAWDGKFHKIEVKVSRPGVTVRTRRGYYAADPTEPPKGMTDRDRLAELLRDPLPATGMVFDARVQTLEPGEGGKVSVEFRVDPRSIAFDDAENGQKHCAVEFTASAFSADGKLLAIASDTAEGALHPETYTLIQKQGLAHKLELKLKPGSAEVRLAVRDLDSGKAGTLRAALGIKKP